MVSFLQEVVNDLKYRFPQGFENVTLVFPNRRASVFFNHYLAQSIDKPVWAPRTETIGDIMLRLSGLKMADSISLVFNLYNCFCQITKSNEPFDEFYFWGEVLLSDFDQIDKHLVDAQKLFSNIKDLKEIETQFDFLTTQQRQVLSDYLGVMGTQSDLADKYLGIWEKLWPIYNQFKKSLLTQGECYEGMAYRLACEKLNGSVSNSETDNTIAFIGFNTLNVCEHRLFNHFKRNGNALFYWDIIDFLQPTDEANATIWENLKLYPNALKKESQNAKQNKPNVTIVTSPNVVSQAKLLPKIFSELVNGNSEIDINTAIVLPNESILLPVLRSIPESSNLINVTIGYPLKETPAYGLAELLVRLQLNAKVDLDGESTFYFRNVLALLNHPFIRLCDPHFTKLLLKSIKNQNILFPSQSLFADSPLLCRIFKPVEGGMALCDYLMDVCSLVTDKMAAMNEGDDDASNTINIEFLLALLRSITRLKSNIVKYEFNIGHKVFFQLLKKVFLQERVSFEGEPLSGVQVMGFLETRVLDFENIVILSFNDDLVPGKPSQVSFVSPSLRKAFGLPNHRNNEAIYAYNFFRLLGRAKNVYLVYSARTEGGASGELSRFALQLQMEYMPNLVRMIDVGFNLSLAASAPISIEKTPEILNELIERLSKKYNSISLSPSGLIAYISCPLRFYFRYVVGLSETDEVAEEVDTVLFGKIIHSTIDTLYQPHCGTWLNAQSINALSANSLQIESVLDQSILEQFVCSQAGSTKNLLSGRNVLIRNALLHLVKRVLAVDEQRAPFFLVGHEQETAFKISSSMNGSPLDVTIRGSIDRLEGNESKYTVIDFKTGSNFDKGHAKNIEGLFQTATIGKNKEVFQIFCYSQSVAEQYGAQTVQPFVWFVRTVFPGDTPSIIIGEKTNKIHVNNFIDYSEEFKMHLTALVNAIFNTNEPFAQTSHVENCKTCPYRGICNR